MRTGLRLLLDREDDIEVVAEAGDGDDGVRAARLEKPDVVLLDVVMPGRNGLDACADVVTASKGRVLMLSMQDDPSYVREAFAAGGSTHGAAGADGPSSRPSQSPTRARNSSGRSIRPR